MRAAMQRSKKVAVHRVTQILDRLPWAVAGGVDAEQPAQVRPVRVSAEFDIAWRGTGPEQPFDLEQAPSGLTRGSDTTSPMRRCRWPASSG